MADQNLFQTTLTQQGFAPEIAPYAQDLLGQAQALTDIEYNPYMQYQGERVAQFSPLQQMSYENAGLMQPQGQQLRNQQPRLQQLRNQQPRNEQPRNEQPRPRLRRRLRRLRRQRRLRRLRRRLRRLRRQRRQRRLRRLRQRCLTRVLQR
jgi:hypothetical protein